MLLSLEEFSTVCCDTHSQRLWCSQYGRSRCFSGTLLLFLLSNGCWNLICFMGTFSFCSTIDIKRITLLHFTVFESLSEIS